jgi:hypothetical protein
MRGPQTSLRENLISRADLRFQPERSYLRSVSVHELLKVILLEALQYLGQLRDELCELNDDASQIHRRFYLQ